MKSLSQYSHAINKLFYSIRTYFINIYRIPSRNQHRKNSRHIQKFNSRQYLKHTFILTVVLFLITSCSEPLEPYGPPVTSNPDQTEAVTRVPEPTEPTKPTESTKPTEASKEPTSTIPSGSRWSDAASWNGVVPQDGDIVTIPVGKEIILNSSTPKLAGLNILGSLKIIGDTTVLSSDWIKISGKLTIGSEEKPFDKTTIIQLTGTPETSMHHIGNRVIAIMSGGVFEIYADAPKTTWTKLAKNSQAGSNQLTLEMNPEWKVGDRIVIASTDYNFEQAEERTITAINGAVIELDTPLDYLHWGELQKIAGKTIDTRAEVAVLSRKVRIESIDDIYAQSQGYGGHIMAMPNSSLKLDGVELTRMGQRGEVGRYPIHWHQAGDAQGDFVKRTSIHHSFNRCITIHGAHNVLIQETVAYESFGHCFFLEDGIEQGNRFERVLGLSIRKPSEDYALLSTDTIDPGPAVFWITNPDNLYINNVAAGSEGSGFWFGLPQHPTGPSATTSVFPRSLPLAGFNQNTAHSNQFDALHVDRGPNAELDAETSYYVPRNVPSDANSAPVPAVFDNFSAFKNRRRAIWLRGQNLVVRGGTFSDNAIGVTMAAANNTVEKSVFIGESANKGTPAQGELTGIDGRSLPLPIDNLCQKCPDKVIRGFEVYDGVTSANELTFANYIPNALREAAALSQLDFTEFEVSPENSISKITISPESKALYFFDPNMLSGQTDGYQSTVFIDKDGSLTGKANQSIVVNQPLLLSDACTYRSDWNAWICDERYISLRFDTVDIHLSSVALSYKDLAKNTMVGMPDSNVYTSNLLPNTDRWYSYDYSEQPKHTRVNMFSLQTGDFVKFSLPYTHSDVFIYRDRRLNDDNRLVEAKSLEELEASSGDCYFLQDKRLYLKLQARAGFDYAAFDICTTDKCEIMQ